MERFPHCGQIYQAGQKMTPIVAWCNEQFGEEMVEQYKRSFGEHQHHKRHLAQNRFWERLVFNTATWSHCDCYVFFKNEKDLILFRMMWPCRIRTEKEFLHGAVKECLTSQPRAVL